MAVCAPATILQSRLPMGLTVSQVPAVLPLSRPQVVQLDKNAKNKVTFADVAGCDEAKVGCWLEAAALACLLCLTHLLQRGLVPPGWVGSNLAAADASA